MAALVSGRDPLTGQALTPQEMFVTWLAFSIPLVSAGALRGFTDDAAEWASRTTLASHGGCSFDAETPVTTDEGVLPIRDVDVGDQVLAWHETLGETGYYTVTAVWGHEDPVTVHLVINGETVETTPEHPFLTAAGTWVTADELTVGDELRSADGNVGVVGSVTFVAAP